MVILRPFEIRQSKAGRLPGDQLFGAGREQHIYALPPHMQGCAAWISRIIPFIASRAEHACAICGSGNSSYLDEVITDDAGGRMFVCSRTVIAPSGRRECMMARLARSGRDIYGMKDMRRPGPCFRCEDRKSAMDQRIGCTGVDFDLWPGEVLGIVGESSSGKSTLLGCLSGTVAPRCRRGDL